MDKFDIFGLTQKSKLPGDRKPLFPEGVPGVSQGIPPEFIKGNQPPPQTAQLPPGEPDKAAAGEPTKKTAAVMPVEEPKPKPKPKPKPAQAEAANRRADPGPAGRAACGTKCRPAAAIGASALARRKGRRKGRVQAARLGRRHRHPARSRADAFLTRSGKRSGERKSR